MRGREIAVVLQILQRLFVRKLLRLFAVQAVEAGLIQDVLPHDAVVHLIAQIDLLPHSTEILVRGIFAEGA